MANNLTGDYEAILQISVRQINGILATLHQNRVDKAASPSFPHSGSVRLGDIAVGSGPDAIRFREWVSVAVQGLRATTGSADNARAVLSSKTPPGVSAIFQQAWHDLDAGRLAIPPTGGVRGRADFQLSTPTISVGTGSVSEVTVHASVRARFYPDAGAAALPEPIHGEVLAVYIVKPRVLSDGRTVLRAQVSPHDNQLQFLPAPGSGLTAADAQEIAVQVRAALRKQFAPVDVTLPQDFAFSEFKALGGGPTQAVALPFQLSGAPFPAGGMPSIANHFLGSSEFAIAVSKEYVQTFLDRVTSSIKASAAALQITVSGPLGTANYTASVSNMSLVWKPGGMDISGRIDLVTGTWWAPNGYISFTQTITVALDVPMQAVSLKPVGEPQVDESWWLSHSRAVNAVKTARDGALSAASGSLNTSFTNARDKLTSGLGSFDKSVSVRYTALEVTPDGIIVRGAIGTHWRFDPVVHYAETDGGNAFTALQSWIPGGRIEHYDWTWVEKTHPIPWFNKTKHIHEDHRFVCSRPADVSQVSGICLLIEGTRISPDGVVESVSAGETCSNHSHEPILVAPSWWMKVMVPIWLPDPPPDFVLSDMIAGHINVVGGSRAPGSITTNTLVHFAGRQIERPLDGLSAALAQMRRGNRSLQVILVLPAGTFDNRRSEVEARLGSLDERFEGQLLITEDYVGGWTKTFAAPDSPSTHLINARGECVWRHEGGLDAGAVARALDEHAIAAAPPRMAPLRLSVQSGAAALDALFTDEEGNQLSLRRLRGQRVLLSFWQSWSTPCIRELRRLQGVHGQRGAPFILAVNGGEGRDVVADVRRRHDLTFALIDDPRQLIGTLYGVQCWPTTLSINEEGTVDRIQFGLAHAHRKRPADARV